VKSGGLDLLATSSDHSEPGNVWYNL